MEDHNNVLTDITNVLTNIEDSYHADREFETFEKQDYYTILIRAFLEIRRLRQKVNMLEAK